MKYLISILFFSLSISVSHSQTLKGAIVNEKNQPLNARLLIKTITNPKAISEFYLVKNGVFSYTLKKKYDQKIIVEVVSNGYINAEMSIDPQSITDKSKFDFTLLEQSENKLEEILVLAKKAPYKIKRDTIVYNVNAYKDGTERKLEDLLRKLPGIEVNQTSGLIKYNGKSIETVTLEGDDLFGYNYTLGTKNINIDMVEEIEAIENYSKNHLLNGIEQSDRVALNLKLKERRTDVSGNLDLGLGDFTNNKDLPLNTGLNLLGINKLYKSFATLSYNNIGMNYSPFDYSNNENYAERAREQDFLSEKIIPEAQIIDWGNQDLNNINNQFFSSFNSIFNLGNKLKTKVNLFYINDRLKSNQYFENNYDINNNVFQLLTIN